MSQLFFIILITSPWASDEDIRLISAVNRFGIRDWDHISYEVRSRSQIECRRRWRQINFNAHILNRPNRGASGARRYLHIRPAPAAPNANANDQHQATQFIQNAMTSNPTSQNIMSIDYILTHDRDVRMTLGYILDNLILH